MLLGIGLMNSFPTNYKCLSTGSYRQSMSTGSSSQSHGRLHSFTEDGGGGGTDFGDAPPQVQRSTIPSRYDVCRMFVTGIVASDPKETYLANGHYVLNFALATVGHFEMVHDWEKYKPTETMWLSAEAW
jgi:Single-strand binding protein family